MTVVYDMFDLSHGDNRNLQHSGLTTCSFVRMEKGLKSRWVPFFVADNTVVIRDRSQTRIQWPYIKQPPSVNWSVFKVQIFHSYKCCICYLYICYP